MLYQLKGLEENHGSAESCRHQATRAGHRRHCTGTDVFGRQRPFAVRIPPPVPAEGISSAVATAMPQTPPGHRSPLLSPHAAFPPCPCPLLLRCLLFARGKGGESGHPQPPSLGAAHGPSHSSFGCSRLLLSSKVTWVSPPAFAGSSVASQQNPKHFPARCTAHHCHFPRETEGKGTGLQSAAQRRASHKHETLTGVNMAVAPPERFCLQTQQCAVPTGGESQPPPMSPAQHSRWSPRASPAPHGEAGTAARDTKGHVGENRGQLTQ